jgi:hypothetical protein
MNAVRNEWDGVPEGNSRRDCEDGRAPDTSSPSAGLAIDAPPAPLTTGQRAVRGLDLLPELRRLHPHLTVQKLSELAGQMVGSSATNIHYAKSVKKRDPETYALIVNGSLHVAEAYERMRKRPQAKPAKTQPRAKRLADIARLASDGNGSDQIADAIGLSRERVRELARTAGIRLADAVTGHRPGLNIHRVVEETVSTLEGLALGLRTIDGARLECDTDEARQWVKSIDASLRVIGRVRKILRGSYE